LRSGNSGMQIAVEHPCQIFLTGNMRVLEK
jgi:hypothetical protein